MGSFNLVRKKTPSPALLAKGPPRSRPPGSNPAALARSARIANSRVRQQIPVVRTLAAVGKVLPKALRRRFGRWTIFKDYRLSLREAATLNRLIEKKLLLDRKFQDVYNVDAFNEVVYGFLRFTRESKKPVNCSFARLDLDHFKPLNDTFGHDLADRVLARVCKSLRKYADSKGGVVCREGGDEFALFMPGVTEAELANDMAAFNDQLATELKTVHPLLPNDMKFPEKLFSKWRPPSASIGVSGSQLAHINYANNVNITYDLLKGGAENALLASKKIPGKGQVRIFTGNSH